MNALKTALLTAFAICALLSAQQNASTQSPLTFELNCAAGDCPLMTGSPQTSGMRGGSVKLKPGEHIDWHSTSGNEEALVILHGSGAVNLEKPQSDVPFHEKMLIHIPPATRHRVTNTGTETLEYVWVVAPAAQK